MVKTPHFHCSGSLVGELRSHMYKAWSSDNTLSGLSMESLLDLKMSLPSTAGHSDHEMPSKHDQICGYERALLTESWPLPAASTKIKS